MRVLQVLASVIAVWPTVVCGQETDLMRCALERVDGELLGQCQGEGDASPSIRLQNVDGRDPFSLRGTWGREGASRDEWGPVNVAPPSEAFRGAGVIEMRCCGWFSLIGFRETPDLVEFTFSWDSEGPPPQDVDHRIVERAWQIMEGSRWDRADDRVCGAEDVAVSLYCALLNASAEEMGQPHHYQTALRFVRGAISGNHGERIAGHALMDFNNHRDTTLDEVREMLDMAAAAIRATIADPSLWPPTGELYVR